MTHRTLSKEEKADVRNARGFQVPWHKIAAHFGMDVDDLKNQMEEPQWKEPRQAELDLWSESRLDAVL